MTQEQHDKFMIDAYRTLADAMEVRMKYEKALSSANEKALHENILVSSISETEGK